MGDSSTSKLLQKRVNDILSHKNGLILVICSSILLVVSIFQFGETLLEWSEEKYATVFNSFSDNIAGRSYRKRLCLPVPIDAVYTWVNGSDPALMFQLRQFKEVVESEVNATRREEDGCHFANCISTRMLSVDPAFPTALEKHTISILYPSFRPLLRMFHVSNPARANSSVTLLEFETTEQLQDALLEEVRIDGKNATLKQVYYTTDWTIPNSVLLRDTAILMGFPRAITTEELKGHLPKKYVQAIQHVEMVDEKNLAVLKLSSAEEMENMLEDGNITVEGKVLTLEAANLLWDLRDYSAGEQIGANRFQDNEELRYSLRSLEQHAPWIRQIFLVTNGQIPSWLNLDSPRLTLVTHEEIFANKSHLPTFSSPAIESHLHRIPGLADKFIYLNDDVMFGRDVWPDDFYTHSTGQKIYLTWPVPNCADGCPQSWIKDGYCDKACNNSECEWDGGDCAGQAAANQGWAAGEWGQGSEKEYCSSGCANSWLADRYCDQSCNVLECGFDAGDCGTSNFNQLTQIALDRHVSHYTLAPGDHMMFFNLSQFLGSEGQIVDGSYDESAVIRNVAIAKKFGVMSVLLQKGHNVSQLNFSITAELGEAQPVSVNFSLTVDTFSKKLDVVEEERAVSREQEAGDEKKDDGPDEVDSIASQQLHLLGNIPRAILAPKSVRLSASSTVHQVNLSHYVLPEDVEQRLALLRSQLTAGDLTKAGFERRQALLWDEFHARLQMRGLQPETRPPAVPGEQGAVHIEPVHYDTPRAPQPDAPAAPPPDHAQGNQQSQEQQVKHSRGEIDDFDANHLAAQEQQHQVLQQDSNQAEDSFKSRKLSGLFPWEDIGLFDNLIKKKEAVAARGQYASGGAHQSRALLDKYSDSLRHVNKLYNTRYGHAARSVPAHMPHLIDRHVMAELQHKFPEEWDETSSHKIRHSRDMQFSFSYFYYLMSEPNIFSPEDVFAAMDTDSSGVLSDRELRTLATRVYDLPLDLQKLTALENMLINCSKHAATPPAPLLDTPHREEYYDKNMPQVTSQLFCSCGPIVQLVRKNFHAGTKYKYELMKDDEVAFKMVKTNVSSVVGQLDDLRREPRKFMCLNDDIDHNKEEAKTTKAVLQDFYESLFPVPCAFELPREYRNRFLHIDELRSWRLYRDWLKVFTQVALCLLILFTVSSFFSDKIEALQRRYLGRRAQTRATAEPSVLQAV